MAVGKTNKDKKKAKEDSLAITVTNDDMMAIMESPVLTPDNIVKQTMVVQQIMNLAMVDGEHYGIIPGTGQKPSLLQPGAQKLSLMFQMKAVIIERVQTDIDHDIPHHREVRYLISLRNKNTDTEISQGVGVCSTMESRYRFRSSAAETKDTGQRIPDDYKKKKAYYAKQGFRAVKNAANSWEWHKVEGKAEKVEHDNPADYHNTVDKIAFKRAFVHAVVNGTACSDIFTQDVEDMSNIHDAMPQPKAPEPAAAPEPPKPENKPVLTVAKPLGSFTVNDLKEMCRQFSLTLSGDKDALIARIVGHCTVKIERPPKPEPEPEPEPESGGEEFKYDDVPGDPFNDEPEPEPLTDKQVHNMMVKGFQLIVMDSDELLTVEDIEYHIDLPREKWTMNTREKLSKIYEEMDDGERDPNLWKKRGAKQGLDD